MVAHVLVVFSIETLILGISHPTNVVVALTFLTHVDRQTSRTQVVRTVTEVNLAHTTEAVVRKSHANLVSSSCRHGRQLQDEVVQTKYHQFITLVVAASATTYCRRVEIEQTSAFTCIEDIVEITSWEVSVLAIATATIGQQFRKNGGDVKTNTFAPQNIASRLIEHQNLVDGEIVAVQRIVVDSLAIDLVFCRHLNTFCHYLSHLCVITRIVSSDTIEMNFVVSSSLRDLHQLGIFTHCGEVIIDVDRILVLLRIKSITILVAPFVIVRYKLIEAHTSLQEVVCHKLVDGVLLVGQVALCFCAIGSFYLSAHGSYNLVCVRDGSSSTHNRCRNTPLFCKDIVSFNETCEA